MNLPSLPGRSPREAPPKNQLPRVAPIVMGALAASMALTGTGYAYWTTHASGTGAAKTAGAHMTVASGDTPSGLYPGGPGSTMSVTLTNTGQGAIKVTSLSPAATTTTSGCTAGTAITFARLDNLPTSLTSSATVRYAVAMAAGAEQACAGAQFTINFTATGTVG
jgi:hypothetical protein